MSRAYNARRKARRQARAAAERVRRRDAASDRRRAMALVPVLLIAAMLAVVGILGFGASAGVSKRQVQQEVTELLEGLPQRGVMLGSPKAPITMWVYGDLECPTVKLFVENYFPSFVDGWVRTGVVRVGYRSLETDTVSERVFFEQEIAALAAGRQSRMWNFLLTFARQQGEPRTDYATPEFVDGVASQVPNLRLPQWNRDRDDALLSKRVALGMQSADAHGFRSTPSFVISYSNPSGERPDDAVDWASMKRDVETTLQRNLDAVRAEAREDFPILKILGPSPRTR